MKQRMKRLSALLCALLLAVGIIAPAAQAGRRETTAKATILFTHDTHSHLLPTPAEGGGEYGGYTRLATLMERERARTTWATLTVDGGDFSMGSLFQTIYTTHAAELRMLGAIGCDVTTLGNHEFDYRAQGLADMLNAAVGAQEDALAEAPRVGNGEMVYGWNPELPTQLPQIVQANYRPDFDGADTEAKLALSDAMERYGVKPYTMIEKAGVRFAVFGLFGEDADDCAPMSGMALEAPIEAAKRVVADIQANEEYDYIICLSHSGTDGKGGGEDVEVAKAVDGIDVIISGHTHSTLTEPLEVNGTFIVSCGEYTQNLGVLTIRKSGGRTTVMDYDLIPVDETVPDESMTLRYVERFRQMVEEEYLTDFGYTADQVLAASSFDFTPISRFGQAQEEDGLGNLIADSYVYAVRQAEGENYVPVDFAVVASGVIRASFAKGEITVSDAFDVSSLGSGADGTPGYPLVACYITGRELKDAFEVDASVTPLMPAAQLYGAGMEWRFNPHRMIFDKVTGCAQVLEDGTRVPIEDDKLYRVVTGLYSAQMLNTVNGQSFGILTITPRNEDGSAVTDFEARILHNENGSEVKEWYALASYLEHLGAVPERYSAPEGRKVVEDSRSPIALLKNPGAPTLILLAVIVVLVLIAVLIVRAVVRRKRKKRH